MGNRRKTWKIFGKIMGKHEMGCGTSMDIWGARTAGRNICGTAHWVQAGQCLGQSQVDPAANQWFLGGFHGGFLSHEGTPKS